MQKYFAFYRKDEVYSLTMLGIQWKFIGSRRIMFKGYFFLFPAIHFVLLIVPGLNFAREWQFDELEIQYVRCLGFWPVFFFFCR